MNKNLLLKIVNSILLLLFISQACSGLFHHALSHKMFEVIHEGGGIVLVIMSSIHLILNWNWIRNNFLRIKQ
ncbi:MAG: hypothetical protein ACP5UA_03765 [Candidatus Hydrogenedens sp.]